MKALTDTMKSGFAEAAFRISEVAAQQKITEENVSSLARAV